MIKVAVTMNVMGCSGNRIVNSMRKYLPDDIDLLGIMTLESPEAIINQKPDIVIGRMGADHHAYNQFWNFITPKALMCEAGDDVVLSYFKKGDILFSYNPETIAKAKVLGINAVLWCRPVDPDIFYPMPEVEKKYDLLTHAQFPTEQIATKALDRTGGNQLVLIQKAFRPIEGVKADYDFCYPQKDNDRMRFNYCSSSYTMSIVLVGEYMPGYWSHGMEVGTTEAAFCKSVPIALDAEGGEYLHYWWDGIARFVRRAHFEDDLFDILSSPYEPLSEEVWRNTVDRFCAKNLWAQFWDAIRQR